MSGYNTEYLSEKELNKIGITFTSPVYVHKFCVIVGGKNITLSSHVRIDAFVHLLASKGYINIDSHVHIGAYSYLVGEGGISIGSGCGLSQGVYIYSASDDYSGKSLTNPMITESFKQIEKSPVQIEKLCIVGCGSSIMPGSKLAEGSSLGAHSMLKGITKPSSIYAGVPAKLIKKRDEGYKNLYNQFISSKSN